MADQRLKDGWKISINEQSTILTHHQYRRYLAWQRSKFSIAQMLPELDHNTLKFLIMAGQPAGPPTPHPVT